MTTELPEPSLTETLTPGPATPGETPATPDIRYTNITGVVIDHGTEAHIGGAVISVLPIGRTTTSASDGTFSVRDIDWSEVPRDVLPSVGRLTIVAEANGYGRWTTKNQDVYSGTSVALEVRLNTTPVTQDYTCTPRAIAAVKPECEAVSEGPSATPAGVR